MGMTSTSEPIRPDELEGLFAPFEPATLRPCALAVSGGSDSTALMVLFADWLRQKRQHVDSHTVLTVDHGLRPESAAEARAVATAAAKLGYRHVTLAWDGPKPRTGIQVAARKARYRLMSDYMRTHGIVSLLTAHTRDDQAETLLMRLARGSGLDGLSAMAPTVSLGGTDVPGAQEIARPLLDVPKARLRATLQARGIAWIEDPTNRAPVFERARLRAARAQLDALGLTDGMLALSAGRLLRARRTLELIVEHFCDPVAGAVTVDPCGYFTIDRARLREAGEEIALRVVGGAIAAAGGVDQPVPLGKLETIVEALCGASVQTPGRWTLARALVTAGEPTVVIEREPGRQPLPEIAMAPGTKVLWDGRFWVSVGSNPAGGSVEVRALGEAALGDLRRRGAVTSGAPVRVVAMVPSIWRKGSLIAVPSLQYWPRPEVCEGLGASFVGMGKFNRDPQWLDGADEPELS